MGSPNGYFPGGENPTSPILSNYQQSEKIQRIAKKLSEEFKSLPQLSPECCIYRVPNRLRGAKEKAYTPQIVSIGPLHHGKKGLEPMEQHKKRYLQSFLKHTGVSVEVYVAVVQGKETIIRHCYADSIDFDSEKFVEIIVVDAAFVIEFFLRFVDKKFRDDVDRIYDKPLMMRHIVPDLQLLENQLPFFILHDLLETAKRAGFTAHREHNSMIEISNIFFETQLIEKNNVKMSEVLHFVHLLRNFYLPEESKEGGKLKSITVPTITELHQAGVKFKKGKPTNLFNITFKDGILTIPAVKLLDRSEILFRNLLAFEHCHFKNENHLTNYFVLMERLVECKKDLKLLVKYGIIEHSMGDNDESSSLIKELVDGVNVDFNNFYFASLCEEMNAYCRKYWPRMKANLKQNYFDTPWAVMSVIAAISLLLLTLTQTIFTIISVYKK